MRRAAPKTPLRTPGGVQETNAYQVYQIGAKKNATIATIYDEVCPQAILAAPPANNSEAINPKIAYPFMMYGDITFQMEKPSFLASGIYSYP